MIARLAIVGILLIGCIRPAEERTEMEKEVGIGEIVGLRITVDDGQAALRELSSASVVLWAQAPILVVRIESAGGGPFELELRNCMPDARVYENGDLERPIAPARKPRPTFCVFQLALRPGSNELHIAPPDWNIESRFKFGVMGDIQTALPEVDDVFRAISAVPDLRFVMSTGDIVAFGREDEYELFEEKLATLDIPFFSTIGNHELTLDISPWHERYGRFNVHFRFKGVDFSFVDSANASLDPKVYEQLETWLEAGRDRVHIFGTHYPPFDPVGIRAGAFRSRNEAYKLLTRLARQQVDLTLYGHIHSYYEFDNADIPAYISGGGGAFPERLDNIGRHFLDIEVDPVAGEIVSVDVSRVD